MFEIARVHQSVVNVDLITVISRPTHFVNVFDAGNFGAGETLNSKQRQTQKQKTDQIDKRDLAVQKIGSVHKNTILLYTSAVKF